MNRRNFLKVSASGGLLLAVGPVLAEVRDAARGLRYREFLTVLLVIDGEDLFPDNWIYIHEPGASGSVIPTVVRSGSEEMT